MKVSRSSRKNERISNPTMSLAIVYLQIQRSSARVQLGVRECGDSLKLFLKLKLLLAIGDAIRCCRITRNEGDLIGVPNRTCDYNKDG